MVNPARADWPDGARFAFTIFDDTDRATIDNVAGVYDFLEEIGMRTTKSVWPISIPGSPLVQGATCDDPAYAAWTVDLQERGFEIGYHGASNVTAAVRRRARTPSVRLALRPHSGGDGEPCRLPGGDDGARSVSGINRLAYNVLTRLKKIGRYRGHVEGDRLFWGDLCRDQVRYVRDFTSATSIRSPYASFMPYHDPVRQCEHLSPGAGAPVILERLRCILLRGRPGSPGGDRWRLGLVHPLRGPGSGTAGEFRQHFWSS